MTACITALNQKTENKDVPTGYYSSQSQDTTNSADINWQNYFNDPYLIALIDTALNNNQELNIMLMEIGMAQNEVSAKKGEYLPYLNLKAGSGTEKVGEYTSQGANDANTEITPGQEFPDPLGDFMLKANLTWEIDIWKKLRNSKKAAYSRYLSSVEGKNFMVTQLVAELANSYYELLALDNKLKITEQNVKIQSNVLDILKMEKQSARVTQLAVNRFEALILNIKGLIPTIQQKIIETENKINFLIGRFPQHVDRDSDGFEKLSPSDIYVGLPEQLLENRPDVKQAELQLIAAKLDVKVAKAQFYPSLGLSANLGLQAFNPAYFIKAPESILFSVAGDLAAPIINRNAIKANYKNANAKQIQAIYEYEKTILTAFIEVSNNLVKMDNIKRSYEFKKQEVDVLNESVNISNKLFASARADYMEVLLTQREALEQKLELIELKKDQMTAWANIYRALGGGWK